MSLEFLKSVLARPSVMTLIAMKTFTYPDKLICVVSAPCVLPSLFPAECCRLEWLPCDSSLHINYFRRILIMIQNVLTLYHLSPAIWVRMSQLLRTWWRCSKCSINLSKDTFEVQPYTIAPPKQSHINKTGSDAHLVFTHLEPPGICSWYLGMTSTLFKTSMT